MSNQEVLLSVDPGIRGSGAALFRGDRLVAAAYVRNPAKKGNRAAEAASMAEAIRDWAYGVNCNPQMAVVEWPQVYVAEIRSGRSKGDPNDLIALAGVSASVTAYFSFSKNVERGPLGVATYLPREWKGNVDADVFTARILTRLDEKERRIADAVMPASLRHNAIDAIGLGLHHLGRLQAKRLITTGQGQKEIR